MNTTEHKTTQKATRLQAAVRRLKTGRRADLIKMGGLLKDIKDTKQYRNMKPWYSKWGLYLHTEKISTDLAGRAIRAFEAVKGLKNLVEAKEYKELYAHMIDMHKTNFDYLCHLTPSEILDLLRQGAYNWLGLQIRDEVYLRQGKIPKGQKELTKCWNMTKKEAALISTLFSIVEAPKGQKMLRIAMIDHAKHIVKALKG